MCLAVPGKIIRITSDSPFTMAQVDFCGVRREICLDTVDNAMPGDYIIAHAGVAISVMDEASAIATIRDLNLMTEYRDSIESSI